MNSVNIMGFIATDIKVGSTQTGTTYASFNIAVQDWQKKSNFFRVTIWGKNAEAFAKFHSKGSLCALSNFRLVQREWLDNSGEKKQSVEIHGNEWSFTSKKADSAPVDDGPPIVDDSQASLGGDDIPF
jgi:single-stranded DNA-binding protein